MAISTGNNIIAGDFVSTPSGAGDSGKVIKLDATGKVPRGFLYATLGGTGSDGSLSIASGTTTINCAGAAVVIKNYTTISITGTAKLAFSNPNANGTTVVLKSQGGFTCTSSTTPNIDGSAMGAVGGAAVGPGQGLDGNDGSDAYGYPVFKGNKGTKALVSGITPGSGGATPTLATDVVNLDQYSALYPWLLPGAGGGSGAVLSGTGSYTSGVGGRGGIALVIECAGAWNFTGTISIAGQNGGDAAINSGGNTGAGGGGAGAAGTFLGLYTTLTANSGTVTTTGGTGGKSAANSGSPPGAGGGASVRAAGSVGTTAANGVKSGGDGAAGYSLIAQNTSRP